MDDSTANKKMKFLIVGGGTAGWMAANLLAKKWKNKNIEITLLESSQIGIIGVGEGSTPQLKGFMDAIDVDEHEWMPECNATYKTGITFKNWSTFPGFESYFHPFPAQADDYTAPAFFYNSFVRRKGIDVEGHPNHFFLATHLAKENKAPIPSVNFPFKVEYGYHFDAMLLGKFLASKAISRGVKHIEGTMQQARISDRGFLECVRTDKGDIIEADFFLDCTGFKGLLLQQALQTPFLSFGENLFNDSAVVLQTEQTRDIASQTVSTALQHGWMWSIPLTNRIGNGYVYSSSYCSPDQAEKELRKELNVTDDNIAARHLSMKVGRVHKHWVKNCLAVGLSQGFIEPLEATALHLVQETIESFIDAYEKGGFTRKYEDQFNQSINRRFEAIRDYIVCHYRVNSRKDTRYWQENANNENISENLRCILESWVGGKNLTDVLQELKVDNYYPSMSWHCLLAGYGVYPTQSQLKAGNELASQHNVEKIQRFIEQCGMNFNEHREQLERLSGY